MNPNYASLLTNRKYISLWSGSFISGVGDSIAAISIIWLIYEQTNNPLLLALSLLCLELPSILCGPLWGVYLDKKPRTLVILANISRGALFIFLIFVSLDSIIAYVIFLLLLAVSSSLSSITDAAQNVLVPKLVKDQELVTANSLMYIQFDMALVLGPMIGGFLAYLDKSSLAFGLNAVTFFIAALIFSFVFPKEEAVKEKNVVKTPINVKVDDWKKEFYSGLTYIKKNSIVFYLVFINFIWNLLIWGTSSTLMPVFSNNQLSSNALGYGILGASTSIGIVIGALSIGSITSKYNKLNLVYLSVILHGVVFGLLGVVDNLIWASALLILSGIVSAPAMIYTKTIIQKTVPEEKQGRIFTVLASVGTFGFPIGTLLSGTLLSILGENQVYVGFLLFGGTVTLITMLLYLKSLKTKKELYNVDC